MRTLWVYLVCLAIPVAAQTPAPSAQSQSPESNRSALEVQPGPPVLKQKDLYEQTGLFHPLLRMPMFVLQDQKAIWTSPFHTSKSNRKWWAIFGAATGALIATDQWTAPKSHTQVSVSNWSSRLGSAYMLVPITAGFYFAGSTAHGERFRETGLLGFEALIDVALAGEAIKLVSDRARPDELNGKGRFESSPNGRWNSSFPSGHALSSWALASVIAHQYPHPRIVPILAYSLASVVVVSRVGARKHFPGDVVAGSAIGWFVGDFVYGKRHNHSLDQKPTVSQRILNHLRISAELQ